MQIAHKETSHAPYAVRMMRTADGQEYRHDHIFGWRKVVPGGHRHAWALRKCTPRVAASCEDAWNNTKQ